MSNGKSAFLNIFCNRKRQTFPGLSGRGFMRRLISQRGCCGPLCWCSSSRQSKHSASVLKRLNRHFTTQWTKVYKRRQDFSCRHKLLKVLFRNNSYLLQLFSPMVWQFVKFGKGDSRWQCTSYYMVDDFRCKHCQTPAVLFENWHAQCKLVLYSQLWNRHSLFLKGIFYSINLTLK